MAYTQVGSVLTASDAATTDQFSRVAMSRDGTVLAVGAPTWEGGSGTNMGGVYIFDHSAGSLTQRGSVIVSGDASDGDIFGAGVALNSDGTLLAVSAYGYNGAGTNRGKVYIFEWSGSSWSLHSSIEAADAADDDTQVAVALSGDGLCLLVGAYQWEGATGTNRGGVYVYDWTGSAWVQRGSVLEDASGADNDKFGYSVAITDDKLTVIVGAVGKDTGGTDRGVVYTYDWSGSAWVQRGSVLQAADAADNDNFGGSVAITADGGILVVGVPYWEASGTNRGGVYIYTRSGSTWTPYGSVLQASDAADEDYYGWTVAVNHDASILCVGASGWEGGATDQGGVYLYRETVQTQVQTDSADALPVPSNTIVSNTSHTESSGAADVVGLLTLVTHSEAVAATDAATHEVIQWFLESIAASEMISSSNVRNLSYADQVAAVDTLVALFNQLVAESSSTSETWYLDTASMIVDVAVATGITTSQIAAIQALAEIVTALEVQATGKLEHILESAAGADIIANLVQAIQAVLEQAVAADAQVSYLLLLNTISESALADESVSVWQSLNQAIEEGGTAFVHLVVAGEVYTGWVMNTQNGAVSEYQGLNFNSLCKIGTKYFGAASDGIYEITGTTDSGTDIATYIQTGLMDFGATHDKSVSDAYLAVDINGRIALGVRVSEKPGPAEFWYEVTMDKDAVSNVKVPIGRGLKGRYWKFEVASEAMSSFDALTVLPSKLTRRV